jgi:hypothetical protein
MGIKQSKITNDPYKQSIIQKSQIQSNEIKVDDKPIEKPTIITLKPYDYMKGLMYNDINYII